MGMIFEYRGETKKAKELYLKAKSIDLNDEISNSRLESMGKESLLSHLDFK
jgi:hypothetical protein